MQIAQGYHEFRDTLFKRSENLLQTAAAEGADLQLLNEVGVHQFHGWNGGGVGLKFRRMFKYSELF